MILIGLWMNEAVFMLNLQGVNTQLLNHGSSKCLVATGVDPGAILKTAACSESPFMYFSLV